MNTKVKETRRKNMLTMKKAYTSILSTSSTGTNEVFQKNLGVSDCGTQTRPSRLADIREEYLRILGRNKKELVEIKKFGEIINRQNQAVAEKSSTKEEQRQVELQVRYEKKEEDKKKKIANNIEKRLGQKEKREKAMESKKNKKLGTIQTFKVPDCAIPKILGKERKNLGKMTKESEISIPKILGKERNNLGKWTKESEISIPKILGKEKKNLGKRTKILDKERKNLGKRTKESEISIPKILGNETKETRMTIPTFKVPGSPMIKVRRPYFVPGKNFALLKRTVLDTITISDDEEVPKKVIKKSYRSNAPTKDFESFRASTSEDIALRDYLKIPTDADASEDDISWMDDINVDEEWWKRSMSEVLLSEEAIRLEKIQAAEEEQIKKNKKKEAAPLGKAAADDEHLNKKKEEDRIKANIKEQIQKFEDKEKARLRIKEYEEEKKRIYEQNFRQDKEDYDRQRMRKDFQVNAVNASEKHQRRKVSRWN